MSPNLPILASIVPYRSYKTLDGDILFGGGNDRLFGVLADKLGYPEWKTDPRYVTNNVRVKNREELDGLIEETTKQKTTQQWLEIFEGSGMPYAAVNDIQGTLNHKHGKLSKKYPREEFGLLTVLSSASSGNGEGRRASYLRPYETRQYASQIFPRYSWYQISASYPWSTH